MLDLKLINRIENQSKATAEFLINPNRSLDTRVKHLRAMYVDMLILGLETALTIYTKYVKANASPIYDEIYATTVEMKEYRKTL